MMPLCLETLPIRNAQLPDLRDHQARMDATRQALLNTSEILSLKNSIQLPDWLDPTLTYKCRVTYGGQIEKIEFEPYQPRSVRSLKLALADDIDYAHKYADRSALNALFAQRGSCDDVLLLRNGFITDTSYANVALYDGNRWYTPAHPLLPGTQRARLLREGMLHTANMRPNDLTDFRAISLVNAMLLWEADAENGASIDPQADIWGMEAIK